MLFFLYVKSLFPSMKNMEGVISMIMIGQGATDRRTYDRERLYGNSNILYKIAAGKHLHCL